MGFIPREEKYFGLLSHLASRVKSGGEIFGKLFQDYQNHAAYAEQIKGIELECDDLSAKITQKLNATFITPIDREDIFLLVTELDDVIDMINDVARRLEMYEIKQPRPDSIEVAGLLARSTVEIADVFALIEQEKGIGDHCRTISQLGKARGLALL